MLTLVKHFTMTKFWTSVHLLILIALIFLHVVSSNLTGSIENHVGHRTRDDLVNAFNAGSQFNDANCHRSTKRPCEPLLVETCFGVKLPYTMTSTELVTDDL